MQVSNIVSKSVIILCSVLIYLLNVPQSFAETVKFRLHGSNTVGAKLAPELVQAWLKHKGFKIDQDKETAAEERLITAHNAHGEQVDVEIHAHGSTTAFIDLGNGATDIGMASRPIKPAEVEKLAPLGQLDQHQSEYVLALDGLAIIVHPSSPLHRISKDLLRKIFSGVITNWSSVGLPAAPIHVYARDDKSGTYDTFKSLVLSEDTPLIKTAKRFESNAKLSDSVAQDPHGIGFVGFAYIQHSKALAVSDKGTKPLMPLAFNVGTEDYVLARRLFLYVPTVKPHPIATEFAEYAVSAAAQPVVTAAGFISQQVIAQKVKTDASVPEEYKELTQSAERLSLNIRFRPGVVELDNKAVRDVQRLLALRERPEFRGKHLMLFGFSDANESMPYMSYSLSVSRADAVGDYLLRMGIAPANVRGYGHDLPVSSNDSDYGRYHNRRVEVWVK